MTRETKIGLLVGLAFIIVVGILLSDHMAATNEPVAAPLETAANTARSAVVSPGENRTAPITRVITPADITPPAQVMTQEEIAQQKPVQQIAVGGPAGQPANATHVVQVEQPANTVVAIAKQHGEELVGANGQPINTVNQPAAKPDNGNDVVTEQPAKPTVKSYVAEDGDNLTKIAAKTMGAGTRANVALIVKANPSLKDNPNLIVVGQEYTIPSLKPVTAVAGKPVAPTQSKVAVLPIDPPTIAPAAKRPAAPQYAMYTVRENDNLWHIAQSQLGDGNAYQQIKDLNKDTLKGSDAVRVGMKLRLPAKVQTASAE